MRNYDYGINAISASSSSSTSGSLIAFIVAIAASIVIKQFGCATTTTNEMIKTLEKIEI